MENRATEVDGNHHSNSCVGRYRWTAISPLRNRSPSSTVVVAPKIPIGMSNPCCNHTERQRVGYVVPAEPGRSCHRVR